MLRRSLLLVSFAFVALPAAAQAPGATDVAGVKYDHAVTVGGQRLLLNGAGIRTRFGFKVYTAGLYLAQKAATPEAVYASSGARRLKIVTLSKVEIP